MVVNRWQHLLVVLGCMFILQGSGITRPIEKVFAGFLEPVKHWWVVQATEFLSFEKAFTKIFQSVAHIQNLELRLAESTVALTELEGLKKENTELRYLLENTNRTRKKTVLTRPVVSLAKPAVSGGKDLQLEKGSLVLSREVLLGQLKEVGEYESQVTLLLEKEATPLLAETETGVRGIILGDGKKILFTEVARTDLLTVGQRIVTVGQPQVEQGIFIGRILKIESDPVASVQTAIVEQQVSFFESAVVEVR